MDQHGNMRSSGWSDRSKVQMAVQRDSFVGKWDPVGRWGYGGESGRFIGVSWLWYKVFDESRLGGPRLSKLMV